MLISNKIIGQEQQQVYKIVYDSIRLMKWLAYFDRSFHENKSYCDMMGSVLKYSNEIS